MKLFLALAALAAVAYGGVSRSDESPAWMLMPGPDGKPQLAVLRGPKPAGPLIEPYTDVAFMLYTRPNTNVPTQMWVDNFNNAPFDPAKPTKIFMHGFQTYGNTDWVLALKDEYLNVQDVNMIIVDWGENANGPLYNVIQERAAVVGAYIGEFLDALVANAGGNSATFHCSGHSLGAHGCGVAGKNMVNELGRVTGLDAALPLYDYNDVTVRLAPEDAAYVDAIHTCGGILGFQLPLGDADFYPNSGSAGQPGCGIEITGACSHSRSHEFFHESLSSTGFVAHLCATWEDYDGGLCSTAPTALMGEPSDPSSRGDYYLGTRRDPPFAQG